MALEFTEPNDYTPIDGMEYIFGCAEEKKTSAEKKRAGVSGILKLDGVTKRYGSFTALKDFSYEFTAGVYGLLGPNGAGKSTLMNIMTDNLRATSGTITYDGVPTSGMGADYRKILGFMPQQQGIYPNFTLERFLYYMAALKGMKKADAKADIDRLLSLVNLQDGRSKRLGGFSGGMKQRALIAQAMLGSPKIVILDEPTAGLDPKERIRIRNLVSEIAFEKIVIIATHVVSDIEFIAKEVLLLKSGRIAGAGKPHELCGRINGKVFEITAGEDKLSEIRDSFKVGNISKDEKNICVRIISENPPSGYRYKICRPDLEDLYLYCFDERRGGSCAFF